MGKKKTNKTKKKNSVPKNEPNKKVGKWLSLIILITASFLIFYPPFVMGLFFNRDVFLYHIFTAVVFMLLWIDKIRRKDYSFLHTPLDWAVLVFVGAYLLSLIGAVHPGEAFYGFLRVLNYFVIFWIISQVLKKIELAETILRVILAAGVGIAVIGIMAALGYSEVHAAFKDGVICSTLQYPNTLAAYLSIVVLIGIALWTREERSSRQFIYLLAGSIMSLAVLASLSKGAWLIYGLGALLLVLGMPGVAKIKALYGLAFSFIGGLASYVKFYPVIISEQPDKAAVYLLIGLLASVLGLLLWRGFIYLYNSWGAWVTTVAGVIAVLIAAIPAVRLGLKSLGEQNLIRELSGLLNFQSSSFVSRMDFNRWGWEIVKDNPINGTGAGGWNALYHQYQDYLVWTTEAHNHFLQVWIESGTIGFLAFIIILGMFCYFLYHIRKRIDKDNWILTWGVATAAISLLAHSVIDFDMSYGAIAIVLWSLIAVINAMYFRYQDRKEFNITAVNKYSSVVLAIVIVFTLGIAGSCFWSAHLHSQKGAIALTKASETENSSQRSKLLQEASNYLNKATELDSFNAEYLAETAHINALFYKNIAQQKHQDAPALYHKVRNQIETAARLKPHNANVRRRLTESAALLGDVELIIEMSAGAITANPNNIEPYIVLANFLWDRIEYAKNNNDYAQAEEYARQLSVLNQQLSEQQKKINSDRPWAGKPLVWPPEVKEKIDQASMILKKG